MSLAVFLCVLAAAAMHAVWNAMIKARLDRFASITVTSLGMALSAAPFLPFVQMPNKATWPWIIASTVIHIGYRLFLVRAYDSGDLAQAYPLARGTAPLLTALGGVFLVAEVPGTVAICGIVLLSLGTGMMSLRGGAGGLNRAVVGNALTTSAFIAAYTLADGIGARTAQDALAYAVWLFVCDGSCAVLIGLLARGRQLVTTVRAEWLVGLVSGFLSAFAYGIAMWAMTRAPIASVAALRETSILFAMGISVFALKERMTWWRALAALSIVGGVIALRIG